MLKFIPTLFGIVSLVLLCCMPVTNITAQTTVTIGTGTSSDYFYGPIYRSSASSSFDYSRYHHIFTATELQAAGIVPGSTISDIAWNRTSDFVLTGGDATLKIYVKNSSATVAVNDTWANLIAGSTLVIDDILNTTNNLPATTGYWTLNFATPFNYTGGSLEVSIDWDCSAVPGSPTTGDFDWEYGDVGATLTAYNNDSSQPTSTDTESSNRPNTQFTFTAPACPGPTGLAVTNITGTTADLSWNTASGATTYNWIVVPAGAGSGATPIANGSTSSTSDVATGLSVTTPYDLYVQSDCGGGTLSLFSGPFSFITGCSSALSGTYTIGGASPDYATFGDAVTELVLCGISSAVTFDVAAGTYTETINIPEIVGSSATNTITFDGAGAANLDYLTGSTQNAIVLLEGADYITFKNLTFNHSNTTDAWGFRIVNESDYVTIENNTFNMGTGTSDVCAILASGSATSMFTEGMHCNFLTIVGNTINDGTDGVHLEGATSSVADWINTVVVAENTMNDIHGAGLYMDQIDNLTVERNTINADGDTSADGLSTFDIINFNFSYNYITATDDGIYISDGNFDDTPVGNSSVFNNMIYSSSGSALYFLDVDLTNIYFNTLVTTSTGTSDYAFYTADDLTVDFRNNICFADAGEAFYSTVDLTNYTIDHNIYYGTGTVLIDAGTNAHATLADWQTDQPTYNVNSLEGDPGFTGIPNLFLIGTLADGAATPIGTIEDDIEGDDRDGTAPDIGADEYDIPTCFPPNALTVSNITPTSADLGWTDTNSPAATLWDVEIVLAGNTPTGTPTAAGVSNPYSATGLTDNTNYEYYVRADCGGSGISPWAGPFAFETPCLPLSAPYIESFDATSAPACWTQSATSGGPWVFGTPGFTWNTTGCTASTPADNTGNGGNYAALDLSGSGATIDVGVILTMPIIDVSSLSVPYLEFYHYMCATGYSPLNETYIEAYDGTAWSQVGSIIAGSASWEEFGFNLSSFIYGTNLVQIRFRAEKGASSDSFYGDIAIDDVSIDEAPSCIDPTNLTASNFTANSADLSWIENGTATAWDVEIVPAGTTPTGTATAAAVGNPYTATGLTPVTTYEYYVRADCGDDDYSAWVGPFEFTTVCTFTLAGTYTIGATGADYVDFSAAITDMRQCGITAPVIFNVDPGTYVDTLYIPEIIGNDATNTITFDGMGAANIDYLSAADQNAIVLLDGVDYITFKNLTFNHSNTTDAWGVRMINESDYVTIENNIFNMGTGTSDVTAVLASGSATAQFTEGNHCNFLTVTGNTINDGTDGVHLEGRTDAADLMQGVTISDNTMNGLRTAGIYLDNQTNLNIMGNTINADGDASSDGIYLLDIVDFMISYNTISATDDGTYISDGNFDDTPVSNSSVFNNMIYSSSGSALYFLDVDLTNVYFNTLVTTSTSTTEYAFYTADDFAVDFRNNICFADAGEAFYTTVDLTNYTIDHNIYYGTGTVLIDAGTNAHATLADWQTDQPAYNVNSLEGDPEFVGIPDLHLIGTLADGAATVIATVSDDIDGDARDASTPDIGADEYDVPTCLPVSALTASNITSMSADLGWTENNTPASMMWNIEWGTAGFSQGSGTVVAASTNPYNLSGLTPSTAYEFYVQSDCGSGDLSLWVGPFAFTTECAPVTTYPACTDFTSNPPNICWNEAGDGEVAAGPTGLGASDWRANRSYQNSVGATVNSNAINLYQSVDREWLLSESYDLSIGGSYQLVTEVAVTNYSFSGTTTTDDTMGSDDEVQLLMSTDNGATWTTLTTWNATNEPAVDGTIYIEDLTAQTGVVQFAFWASDGTTDDVEDYDFHVGVFCVAEILAATAVEASPETCAGDDGSAMASATGGVTPYTYLWDDATAQMTATATGLAAGMYNVIVTDAIGSTATASVMVTNGCTADPCVDGYEAGNQLTGMLDMNADYETDQGIDSDQIIGMTTPAIGVDYDAGIDIDLLPGFEVKLGVEFDAFIDGCAGGTSDGAGGNQ